MMTAAAPPGTVCCLLCRGMIAYRNCDPSRFHNHMNYEHGAYFDMEFLLSACMMDEEERQAVRNVMQQKQQGREEPAALPPPRVEQQPAPQPAPPPPSSLASVPFWASMPASAGKRSAPVTASEALASKAPRLEEVEVQNEVKAEVEEVRLVQLQEQVDRFTHSITASLDSSNAKAKVVSEPKRKSEDFSCSSCDESFPTTKSLRKHIVLTHSTKKVETAEPKMVTEPTNESIDKTEASLVIRKEGTKVSFPCEEAGCEKLYFTRKALNNHTNRAHTSLAPPASPAPPPAAPSPMSTPDTSTASTDAGPTPTKASEIFACIKCAYSCKNKANLSRHVFKAHPELQIPEEKLYECMKCDQTFKLSSQLKTHVRNVHPGVMIKTLKEHIETQEGKIFKTKNSEPQENSKTETDALLQENDENRVKSRENSPVKSEPGPTTTTGTLDELTAIPEGRTEEGKEEEDDPDDPASLDDVPAAKEDTTFVGVGEDEEKVQVVDTSSSRYFKANPQTVGQLGDKENSLEQFDITDPRLPAGWQVREIVTEFKSGRTDRKRHFLTPDRKILKTGLSVLEYMRLSGCFSAKQIMDYAKYLSVPVTRLEKYMELYL